jgi:CubicO group peptidase (beta-lactamase class C family)
MTFHRRKGESMDVQDRRADPHPARGDRGVALIRDGRVVFLRSYGKRDVARELPLTPDTVMYGASLTKATFAWFVMQLVDEHRVDLDRPIATYLSKPLTDYPDYADLADDPRWRALTFRILLGPIGLPWQWEGYRRYDHPD